MRLGRYQVPTRIIETVEEALGRRADPRCFYQSSGIYYFSYVCDPNLRPAGTIQGAGHSVWLALNPTVRCLRVSLNAKYRNGHIEWGTSRSLKILVRGSDLKIRDRVTETHGSSKECRYAEWSQPFSCNSSGKEGVVTQFADQEMEAHFSVLCPGTAAKEARELGVGPVRANKSVFLSHISSDKSAVVRPLRKR